MKFNAQKTIYLIGLLGITKSGDMIINIPRIFNEIRNYYTS